MLVALGVGEGDASVLAFFLVELEDEPELVSEVVDFFFAAGELDAEAVLAPDFFAVDDVPVAGLLAVLLAVFVVVDVSLCAHETTKPAATVRTVNGNRNFFIGVFGQPVQALLKSQAYS